jgi:iron complex transport system ATP-binding protein
MKGLSIQLTNICVQTPQGVCLLDCVNLAIAAGQRCAVVGPNGAGKSSLLGVISGRLAATAGAVQLGDAADLHACHAQRALHLAMVGQTEQVDLRLSVLDYVALGRVPHQGYCARQRHQDALGHALAMCSLQRLAGRGLHTLSGGERQRAHLARALAQEPSVLLLDEPTNHLDLRARLDLLDLVRGLGITVVAVLHELSLVPSFADEVVVLNRGQVLAQGAPQDALSADTVERVFGMSLVRARHPHDDRSLWFFERLAA